MESSPTPAPATSGTSASNPPTLPSVSSLVKRVSKLNDEVSLHPSTSTTVARVAAELLDLLCETTDLNALRTLILDHQTLGPLLSPAVLPSFYQALQRIEESVSRLQPPRPQSAPPGPRPRNPPVPPPAAAQPAPTSTPKSTPAATYAQAAKAPAAPQPPTRKFNPSPKVASAYRRKKNTPSQHGETLWSPSDPDSFDVGAIRSGPAPLGELNALLSKCVPPCALKGLQWTERNMVLLTPTRPEDADILPVHAAEVLSKVFGGHAFRQYSYGPSTGIVCYGAARGSPANHSSSDMLNLLSGGLGLSPSDVIPAKARWLVAKSDEATASKPSFLLHITSNETAERLLASNPHFIAGVRFSLKKFKDTPTVPNQCQRCFKVGHSTLRCSAQTSVCGICGEGHATASHACASCATIGVPCTTHPLLKCANCGGNHPAWNPTCVNRLIQMAAQPPKKKKGVVTPPPASLPIAAFVRAIPPGSTGYSAKTASLKDAEIARRFPKWCAFNKYPVPAIDAQGHVSWNPPAPGPDNSEFLSAPAPTGAI
ncbi:hypothetical protein BOTBODRAFT_181186 [Botryobasidium botryosum FD-172 SS1]|uniref:CCHC-type domain-containing protein n=1 Tax=Botryobasidium botryosum (strain FD-172 SS1) TaxID=930990 RepID=A0A067M4T2_BOTB1|nr:hypothetical protein BOTBODRAFT_181186 [Botryobasidium botryosum FD-172 SS1]